MDAIEAAENIFHMIVINTRTCIRYFNLNIIFDIQMLVMVFFYDGYYFGIIRNPFVNRN